MHGTVKLAIEFVNGVAKTEALCFPRSGHHLLKNILEHYLGGAMNYCSVHEDEESKRIGAHPLTNFQKNHDFDLKWPITDDRRYLVQTRDPIDAIESWFHLEQRMGKTGATRPEYEVWRNYIAGKLDYWRGFVDKWIYSYIPNRLVVSYADLLHRPESTVTSVIQHLQAKAEVDAKKLNDALDKFKPKPQFPARPAFYERA